MMHGLQTAAGPPSILPAVLDPEVPSLRLGLVNNMRGAGFRNSNRQFRALVAAAGAGRAVVSGYTITEPEAAGYRGFDALYDAAPDGLIITGAEPSAADLRDEPYYPALTRLIDHAIAQRIPALFSCLAAHMAVQHLSGVPRRRLSRKCHGVFRFAMVAENGTSSAAERIVVPHSRWNSLDHAALAARGYRVLAISGRAGVDRFVHDDAPRCLFLQGHPEYERTTLQSEYRRDLRRYQSGETAIRPLFPVGCPDRDTRAPWRDTASPPPWQGQAVALYRSWFGQITQASHVPL